MHPLASTLVAMFSGASALAQPAAPSATQPPSPAAPGLISTVWDLTLKGGPVMIPIAICSLVALALVVERLLSLRRARVMPPEFVVGVRPALSRGQGAALEFCRSHPSPVARVLEAGIRRWDRPIEQVEKHITEAGLRETILLRKNFRGLVVITGVAPLLGLLGTIFGMITAFRTVAASADALGRTELLAAGIYEAMVTTAAGLIVAIPTLLTYHALAAKVDRLVFDIDAACIDLIEAHDQRASATPPAPAPSTIAPSTTAPATTAPTTTTAGVSAAANSASHMTHARPVADLGVVEAKEPEPAAA
ncbi:MAG: MotA/TolQ/ExbB proton channel family protein [Phycisphaerae bacterium]|nr:MotA/TolQ/ExbB proton channel family protein [Phycisphaerae bacterium]